MYIVIIVMVLQLQLCGKVINSSKTVSCQMEAKKMYIVIIVVINASDMSMLASLDFISLTAETYFLVVCYKLFLQFESVNSSNPCRFDMNTLFLIKRITYLCLSQLNISIQDSNVQLFVIYFQNSQRYFVIKHQYFYWFKF